MTAQPRSNRTPAAASRQDSTSYHQRAYRQVLASLDDLLYVHKRPDSYRAILEAVRSDLETELADRLANHAAEDAAADRRLADDEAASETAYAIELVRSAIRDLGPGWRHAVPLTAWKCRAYVHLSILEAENDPARLNAALDRIYGGPA